MHELPITESVLKIALNAAGGRRITAIHLTVGDLASIVDDAVQFYFDIISKGTDAEGAVLHFRRQPGVMTCLACGQRTEVRPPLPAVCPRCGEARLRVTGGRELRVESIEVSDDG
jgi:hydrogenase nickel incorporation protein HypA/HybF